MTTYSQSLQQLVRTLLRSSSDSDTCEPLDDNHDIFDVDDLCLKKLESDFNSFVETATSLIQQKLGEFDNLEDFSLLTRLGLPLEHDYILTRNHHGAGFWDGDWDEKVSQILTDTSQLKPEIEPYIGDDGKIYF